MDGKKGITFSMVEKLIALILLAVVLTGCSTPRYEDGTKKEYSDMPWNTPARWEGSMNIPGMSGN
jgi:PBP1b-binding outer membrane lipoprotein LpoB